MTDFPGYDAAFGFHGPGLPFPADAFEVLEAAAHEDLARAAGVAQEVVAAGAGVQTVRERFPPIPLLVEESRRARMIVLGPSGRGGGVRQVMAGTRQRHHHWIREHGEDLPEVRNWTWA
ncbi:hypothetical protein [Amycolatopsis pithecellobii]|uniref:Uncharacterized protein n=1 Tax=Amycolatopsis pithecellobii TaxID=664692 RepID=A0A6N7YRK0_9PSEU|nr:hypothetical protein [Amycolatopsis pithecellobii]MTD54592.1 hypothetical protein [Amycolatopsis pithecellobii]